MDHDLYSRLQYELKELEDFKKKYAKRLSVLEEYRGQRLKRHSPKRRKPFYTAKRKGASKYKYAGKEDNLRVQRIKEATHLDRALSAISEDISLIQSLLEGYKEHDPVAIDCELPGSYRSKAPYPGNSYMENGRKWKAEKLAFQAGFPENYPEHKTEQTSDGTWVKTLSEVVLYERFLSAGLIFIYELPLASKDYGPNLYPDFTILSPIDCKTEIVVEYIGRLDLPKYREDFAKRIYRYMQNGYIPGVNLFFAYGDERGHVDSLQINKIIADILGVR